MKVTIFISGFLFLAFLIFAEGKKKPHPPISEKKYLREHPVWIQCIDSPHASYSYAIYAFETFWKDKARPMGEDGEMEKFYENGKQPSEAEAKYFGYAYDYKRFLEWKHRVARMLDGQGRVYTREQVEEHFRIRTEAQYK
jgi:hypothetical protein